MGKLFGTDGIRGRVNTWPLTPEIALRTGTAIARSVAGNSPSKPDFILIARDTRTSGVMLEDAVTAGVLCMGVDVCGAGVLPTPALARLTAVSGAAFGVMITASHNPAEDNGIKVFGPEGFKLTDAETDRLEEIILGGGDPGASRGEGTVGRASEYRDAVETYMTFARDSVKGACLSGLKVVLDCANGAASAIAPEIFRRLGCEVEAMNFAPDGMNINRGCGAVCPEPMCEAVRRSGADVGIALDGDADRVIFCDASGAVVNGDRIIGMTALEYRREGRLAGNTVVVTNMSNMGLYKAMEVAGIAVVTTDVGDHNVIEAMRRGGFILGGEQSGHVIFMDCVTTGDGIITGLNVLKLMRERDRGLRELAGFMEDFPQRMISLPVTAKPSVGELPHLERRSRDCRRALEGRGRSVIRYSGTESKLRILVEADEAGVVDFWLNELTAAVRKDGILK